MVPSIAQPLALKYLSEANLKFGFASQGRENLLDEILAAAVGTDRRFLLAFGDGDFFGVAVNGAGAGEDEVVDAGVLHRLKDTDRGGDVVVVIHQRLLRRLADVRVRGEVHHGVDLVIAQRP